jgi:hypothetical protein
MSPHQATKGLPSFLWKWERHSAGLFGKRTPDQESQNKKSVAACFPRFGECKIIIIMKPCGTYLRRCLELLGGGGQCPSPPPFYPLDFQADNVAFLQLFSR